MVIKPWASTATIIADGFESVSPRAVGSLIWMEGRLKEEVSMKKIRRRKTTSIRGAISMEVVTRFGRVNIGSIGWP